MPQLIWLYGSWFLLVEVREGLFECFPLKLDFFKDSLLDIHFLDLVLKDFPVKLIVPILDLLQVLLVLGVLMRIMPKIEPFALLDLPSHPLAKVSIVDLPFALVSSLHCNFKDGQAQDDQLREVQQVYSLW
jgi:hypothetical protein